MLVNYQNRIASIVSILKEIPGKVEFHKILFILQNEGVDFDKFYRYNVFGPYSEEFQLEINDLVNQNILSDKGDSTYIVSDKHKVENDEVLNSRIDLITYVGHLDRDMLELVATIYYFKNLGYSDNMVKEKLSIVKPNLANKYSDALTEIGGIKQLAQTKN